MSQQSRTAALLASPQFWAATNQGMNPTSELMDKQLAAAAPYVEAAYRELEKLPLVQVSSALTVLLALRPLIASAQGRAAMEVAGAMEREREERAPVDYRGLSRDWEDGQMERNK